MTPYRIRQATLSDAAQVASIYGPYCAETPISFELEAPTTDEMQRRMASVLIQYPWLVCEDAAGEILGYVYAHSYHERAAYQWTAEVVVYIRRGYHRQGIARALYSVLLRLLTAQGYYTAIAGVTLPNAGSVGLHESFGLTQFGEVPEVGYKCGAWYAVGFWQLALQPKPQMPVPPKPISELVGTDAWTSAIGQGIDALERAGRND